jgi:DNA-binding ferritin-like protein
MLAGLIHAESALYAITREWRYEAAGRKFVQLHLLLDEQFCEIGIRLARLAARSRELGAWNCTGHGDGAASPQAVAGGGALQTYMIRELLGHHENLAGRLRRTRSVTGGRFADNETAELMAALAAEHEKDAFMLRALLWEVGNIAA